MTANPVEKKFGKVPFLFAIISVLVLASLALFQLLATHGFENWYYIAALLSFCVGFIHLIIWLRFFLRVFPGDFARGIALVLVILMLAFLVAAIAYHYLKLNYWFLSYCLPFVLPFLGWQVFRAFGKIPRPVYKTWQYPLNQQMPDLDMIDLSQIEVIQFVFPKKPTDTTQTNFTSKAPLNMTLGQLFFIFINDYNERNSQNRIEYMKDGNIPCEWQFYRKKKWFGRKFYFDTELSFKDNGIRPNEQIYAARV
jgi:type VI secretion system TssN-like protein